MTVLWSPKLKFDELGSKRIDVSEVDEVRVESEGYVRVTNIEHD